MRVLIAGCGYVGTALGIELAAAGHTVWGLSRQPSDLPAAIRPLAADLTDPASLRSLPEDLEAVAYTAAAAASTEEAYVDAYVRGLDNLLAALRGVKRVLFTSSTAVYGQNDGGWMDESSPTEPAHFSGKRLLEAEGLVLGSRFPGVVLRLGGIYGPGRTRLVRQVQSGEARRPAVPSFTNRIHRDDCAGAIAHLLSLERPESIYLGVDHEPADLGEVMSWLAAGLGVPVPAVEERPPEGRRARAHKRCRNDRLVAAGYRFRYPTFREGYCELVLNPPLG